MIKALMSDFSRVLLFPKDKSFTGSLNEKYRELLSGDNFRFFDHFNLNDELLEYYRSLTSKLDLFIFTSETIQEAPELETSLKIVFKDIFSAKKLGISKKDPSAYELIAKRLRLQPSEILYIDDNIDNFKASSLAGLQTLLFNSNQQIFEATKSLGKK